MFASGQKKAQGTESTGNAFNADQLKLLQQNDLQQYFEKADKGTLSFKEYKPQQNGNEQQQEEGQKKPEEGGLYFFHPDHLGTDTFLTDANGLAYEFFINLPFGETMAEQHSQTEEYANRWKFTGHELDKETGLYYAKARFYDPKISIFLSVDPLAEQFPSWNPYHYVHQNPAKLIDPTG